MSILETFYLLFKTDTTDLKKGADEVQSSTNKMDAALDKTAHHSEHLSHAFHHIKREITGLVLSMVGIGAAIEGIKATFEYADKVSAASDALSVNVSQLDAWNQAVVKAGGTAEGFDQSLKNVANHFKTSNQTALDVLPQLAGLFQHMSKAQSFEYGKKIGLDEPTILLLQKGRREVEAIIAKQKELGVVTKQDKENIDKFNLAWNDTKQEFRNASLEAEMGILPTITKLLRGISETIKYLENHKGFVEAAFLGMAAAALVFQRAAIATAIKSAAAWVKFLGPIGAVGVAIGLLYDDWQAFKRGDESVTGEIMKRWPEVGNVIIGTFGEITKAINYVLKAFDKLEMTLAKYDGKVLNLKGFHLANPGTWFNPAITAIKDSARLPINYAISSSLEQTLSLHQKRPETNKNTSVSVGDITINTQATDAQGISAAIGKNLYDHLFQLTSNFDDGQVI